LVALHKEVQEAKGGGEIEGLMAGGLGFLGKIIEDVREFLDERVLAADLEALSDLGSNYYRSFIDLTSEIMDHRIKLEILAKETEKNKSKGEVIQEEKKYDAFGLFGDSFGFTSGPTHSKTTQGSKNNNSNMLTASQDADNSKAPYILSADNNQNVMISTLQGDDALKPTTHKSNQKFAPAVYNPITAANNISDLKQNPKSFPFDGLEFSGSKSYGKKTHGTKLTSKGLVRKEKNLDVREFEGKKPLFSSVRVVEQALRQFFVNFMKFLLEKNEAIDISG
jgi:hypothetical protein